MVAPPAFPVSAGTGGSVEICMYEIGRRLSKDHHVTLISRKSPGFPSKSQFNHFKIVRLPIQYYWHKVIQYAKKRHFDIIQIDNRPEMVPLFKKHFPSTRILLNLHSLTFMSKLNTPQQRKVMQHTDAVLCNSHYIKQHYRTIFPPFAKKVHAIHLGTDVNRFRLPTAAEKEQIRSRYAVNKTYNLLYSGRIIPKKGIGLLIKSASLVKKKYPPIHVILVGPCSRSYRNKQLRMARRLHVPLTFTGNMPPSTMHHAYWLGDCLISPTQFKEAFGLVNVEAMASGLPVIASHRGGIPEILNGQNGITIRDYQNPQAFAKAILSLISLPSLRKKLIEAGYQTAHNRFSWSRVARDYEHLYELILSQR